MCPEGSLNASTISALMDDYLFAFILVSRRKNCPTQDVKTFQNKLIPIYNLQSNILRFLAQGWGKYVREREREREFENESRGKERVTVRRRERERERERQRKGES